MKPVRDICRRCLDKVKMDTMNIEYKMLVMYRLDNGKCLFTCKVGGEFSIFLSQKYNQPTRVEPRTGVVPDFCPYTTELAVSQA